MKSKIKHIFSKKLETKHKLSALLVGAFIVIALTLSTGSTTHKAELRFAENSVTDGKSAGAVIPASCESGAWDDSYGYGGHPDGMQSLPGGYVCGPGGVTSTACPTGQIWDSGSYSCITDPSASCANGATNPPTCTTCPSGYVMYSGTCELPATGSITASACTIPANGTSCTTTVSWSTNKTTSVGIAWNGSLFAVAGSGSQASTPINPSSGAQTFELKYHTNTLDSVTIYATCAAYTTWNGTSCPVTSCASGAIAPSCTTCPTGQVMVSGSCTPAVGNISATPVSCTIPVGGSMCNSNITWTSNVTVAKVIIDGTTFATGQNGSQNAPWLTPHATGQTFILKNGTDTLGSVTTYAKCAAGSTWNGSKCAATACSNGATNYPTCTTCASGYTMLSGVCTSTTSCANGAVNPPTCSSCPVGFSMVAGACQSVSACGNGAINPPTCSTCAVGFTLYAGICSSTTSCSNGAINPPACSTCAVGYSLVSGTCTLNTSCSNGAIAPACTTCSSGFTMVAGSCAPATLSSCDVGIVGFADKDSLPDNNIKYSPWCGTGSYTYGPYETTPSTYGWQCAAMADPSDVKVCSDYPYVPLPISTSTVTVVNKFVVTPVDIPCGGGNAIVSWDMENSSGKSCSLTATTSNLLSSYPASEQSARSADIAKINTYLATTKYDSKVDASVGYTKAQSYAFNTQNAGNHSIAEIAKIPVKYSTKFIIQCGTLKVTQIAKSACQFED